jgi:organic hydroperoxide reductase OsmC/OhrA
VQPSGGGRLTTATLRPVVTVLDSASVTLAQSLHEEAAELCFIAASVAFPVLHEPETTVSARTL